MHRRRQQRGRGGGRQSAGATIHRFLEPCLLLLLHQNSSYGYELVSALKPFGFGDIAGGPVYRTLRELEAAGMVRSKWDTESPGGPARRVYQLTEGGHRCLVDWVEYLRGTQHVLQNFLTNYDQHMNEDKGEYHQ